MHKERKSKMDLQPKQQRFHYVVAGTAAGGQTWEVEGEIAGEYELDGGPPDLRRMMEQVGRQSFVQLTQGKAVFGHPGVGCIGPYTYMDIRLMRVA
jgi:hypothetical protein